MADYAFIHNDVVFTPNGTKLLATEAEARNAAIEAAELAHWNTKPDSFCGYVVEHDNRTSRFTTWRGVNLGRVVRYRSWRNNFGSLIISVRVHGTNGADYSGRYAPHTKQFLKVRRLYR